MEQEKLGTLRDHEKFWAFIFLVIAVVTLVFLASSFGRGSTAADVVMQGKLRIIDAAITGLLTITGMAAQALFRINSTDKLAAETALENAKKAPAATQPVTIEQPANQPVPTKDVTEEPEGDKSWMRS